MTTEEEMRAWLESADPTEARHARLRLARAEADGFFRPPAVPAVRPPASRPSARTTKPRLSFDQLAAAKRDCVPCREQRKQGVALFAPLDDLTYVTTARLLADTRALIGHLPPDVDCVAAIPRSGLLPGALIAYHLHCPLWTVSRQAGVVFPGHGGRMDGPATGPARHVLIVDDTAALGQEMAHAARATAAAFPGAKITRAAIYCHPQALHAVDLCVSVYPGGHYLEWNVFNSGHGSAMGTDWDGILCKDCPVEDDDDGPRYLTFIRTAIPLNLPRRMPVPLIVTARHEKYRAECLAWLDRWGVRAEQLHMRNFDYGPDRLRQIAEFKATHYRASGCVIFAESDPAQARLIAELTRKPILCPIAEKVFT
jgi:hypothetical protein